ncbi:hypothetical protein [Herbaspirillum aquaticum]|jgi:hypothetical protein|uniref:Uncharacterized protein n=1 Tax=Herbaspirillum aquaticum TaxID=568783 RepID=A0A225SZH7_9BURK|nr:hypothetical protein [Herbaspirillum aquaticum]OWY36749.1 hypothetical protein CEJ45_01225 [Herbaspirillum aquaticum]
MDIQDSPLLKEALLLLAAKRTMLWREAGNIDTVVVGSSHGEFGFHPGHFPGSFNLCFRSQDLKHSFHLYRHMTLHYPKVRHLIIYYSLFSPGSVLEKSPSEKDISPALNELFHLELNYEDERLIQLASAIRGRLDHLTVELEGVGGFIYGHGVNPPAISASKRASDHLRLNKPSDAHLYLVRMLLLAKHLGHSVSVVIPPARSDYRAAVGLSSDVLFKGLYEILYDFHLGIPVNVVNCYGREEFQDVHFGDYDHLAHLGEGTALLTKFLFLQRLEAMTRQ